MNTKVNQESAVARLVEISNDPRQPAEVRSIARGNIQKNAPHLILPDQRIVPQEMYDRLAILMEKL